MCRGLGFRSFGYSQAVICSIRVTFLVYTYTSVNLFVVVPTKHDGLKFAVEYWLWRLNLQSQGLGPQRSFKSRSAPLFQVAAIIMCKFQLLTRDFFSYAGGVFEVCPYLARHVAKCLQLVCRNHTPISTPWSQRLRKV